MRQQTKALKLKSLPRSSRLCPHCHGTATEEYVDGETLRKARQAAGKSLRQMAKDLSLSAPYLSDIERNRRNATDYVVEMYDALLLGGD